MVRLWVDQMLCACDKRGNHMAGTWGNAKPVTTEPCCEYEPRDGVDLTNAGHAVWGAVDIACPRSGNVRFGKRW